MNSHSYFYFLLVISVRFQKGLKWLGVLVFLLTSIDNFCQPVASISDTDYIIDEFVLPGGRQGNNINCIVQGPYGFMWFGGHGGLHRYDGYEFVTYRNVPGDTIGETTSLTFPYVENLYWDRFNMLWVSTYGGGLYRFNPETEKFKHFVHHEKDSSTISDDYVVSAVEDAEGNMWFGTQQGLNRFDRKTETFKRYYANPNAPGALNNNEVRSLYVDKQGTLWVGAGFVFFGSPTIGALSRYDSRSDSFINYVNDPNDDKSIWSSAVRGLLEDSQGNFWVGTDMGLNKMNRLTGTFQRMAYDPTQPYAPGAADRKIPAVYSIHEDSKGGIWVGTIGEASYPTHLLRYDPATKKSKTFPVASAAWQICESSDGTIWVAGAGMTGKVMKIKPKTKSYNLLDGTFIVDQFPKTELSDKLKEHQIYGPWTMAIDSTSGHHWLLMFAGNPAGNGQSRLILADFNPKTKETTFHYLPELVPNVDWSLPANQVEMRGLIIDENGTIWGSFASDNIGIFNYDPKTRKIKQYLHDPADTTTLSSNGIVYMLKDKRGDIWAATYGNGLNRLNPKTEKITRYHFNKPGFGENDYLITLMEDRDGMIWAAGEFYNQGISFFGIVDPLTNKISKIEFPHRGSFYTILNLAQSPIHGEVIFTIGGEGNGVGFFQPSDNSFFFSNEEEGFPFKTAAGVVCDRDGIFWIADVETSTYLRMEQQLSEFVFQESSSMAAQWRNGLLGPNGHVYFIAGNGWVEINPAEIKPEISKDSTAIHLTDLFILGEKQKPQSNSVLSQPVWLMKEIELPATVENFGFRFSDFNFQTTGVQFQYRLFPYESEWKRSNSPSANYYRIPPGKYTFQVKLLNQSSKDKTAALNVIVLPPWYSTWWAYGMYSMFIIGGVFFVDRYQRKRLLEKSNAEAKERELQQAKEIEKAYTELKATQAQLIQSEKMASLGELTAGIAHEIQNPLNFVNNFSEVNTELIRDLKSEIQNGNFEEVKALANNIESNEEKIVHHGKRAEGIVKGMLQHSRSSSGQKELTDINALCDEYLRLSYHGLRAKDKSFNAKIETTFDLSLPQINVVTQDIGRVLLNLINNAFYACTQRSRGAVNEKPRHFDKLSDQPDKNNVTLSSSKGDIVYEPIVSVSTKNENGKVLITVKDNGNGIPDSIKEKIFQPFFTTKPTGQGTGLGLSLSYDIVKAHGGELKVETKEGEGSEFTIVLPLR